MQVVLLHTVAFSLSFFMSKTGLLFQRVGAVFPPKTERSAPVFTPPQTQPLSSYPQNIRNSDRQETAESSAESEFPTLRYSVTPQLFEL